MKDNQRKRGEQIELFLFVVVLAVFAAVIGVVTSGGKKQAMEQMRILSSGESIDRFSPMFSAMNCAVGGMSCMSPRAPAELTASSRKLLSARITAKASSSSTPYSSA